MASSSSSSSPSSPFRLHPQWKYKNDVYVNSGEDVLDDFSSHLFDGFGRESINFLPDERLQKGAEATLEHFKAIEGSKISVLPSDVRWQERSFGRAFVEHERNQMPGLKKWKTKLRKASLLAGCDSEVIGPEAALVQAIVNDIVKKLESIADSMVKELESLFGLLRDRLDSLASSFLDCCAIYIGCFARCSQISKTSLLKFLF